MTCPMNLLSIYDKVWDPKPKSRIRTVPGARMGLPIGSPMNRDSSLP